MDPLPLVKSIAVEAGQILLRYYNTGVEVYQKPEGPQTVADRESNEYIVSYLKKAFPLDAILAEESVMSFDKSSENSLDNSLDKPGRLANPRVWCVDPLDDTKGYIQGGTTFTVIIGLAEHGRPILGVVYQPFTQKLYFAQQGRGAFMIDHLGNQTPLHVSSKESIDDAVILLSNSRAGQYGGRITQSLPRAVIKRQSGSIKTCLVASGEADAFICPRESPMMDWDLCGPEAILIEAGGSLTHFNSELLRYNQSQPIHSGFIASNGRMHQKLIDKKLF